jgi:hypothetical protein
VDYMGGHLLADRFARKLFAGPYIDESEDDLKTPAKEPRGGPFDQNSFNDDPGALAPPKPLPTKPTPRGIPPRPNVPMLMAPQSLQVQRQPLLPGEMPAEALPGENGKPPSGMSMLPFGAPGMGPPRMPGTMQPLQTHAPGMPGMRPQRNAPPSPGLKPPPKTPSLKSPKPVSKSPSSKPPSMQSKSPSKPSPSSPSRPSPKPSTNAPSKAASFTCADYDFLNTAGPDDQFGPMQPGAPLPSAAPPPTTPAPMQSPGLPSVGDLAVC